MDSVTLIFLVGISTALLFGFIVGWYGHANQPRKVPVKMPHLQDYVPPPPPVCPLPHLRNHITSTSLPPFKVVTPLGSGCTFPGGSMIILNPEN